MRKKDKKQNFGLELKAFLDNEGRRYNWLCREAQISWVRMQRIFGGSQPRTEELLRIANALGMTVDDLLHLDGLLQKT